MSAPLCSPLLTSCSGQLIALPAVSVCPQTTVGGGPVSHPLHDLSTTRVLLLSPTQTRTTLSLSVTHTQPPRYSSSLLNSCVPQNTTIIWQTRPRGGEARLVGCGEGHFRQREPSEQRPTDKHGNCWEWKHQSHAGVRGRPGLNEAGEGL